MNRKEKKKLYDKIYNKQKDNGLGNPKDDKVFLKYKHKLDECSTAEERQQIIESYKPLEDSEFEKV